MHRQDFYFSEPPYGGILSNSASLYNKSIKKSTVSKTKKSSPKKKFKSFIVKKAQPIEDEITYESNDFDMEELDIDITPRINLDLPNSP